MGRMQNKIRRDSRRRARQLGTLAGLTVLAVAVLGASSAQAAVGPYYDVRTTWGDTNLPPGGRGQLQLQVRNIGDEFAEQDLTIRDELPAGVTATSIFMGPEPAKNIAAAVCSGTGTVECVLPGSELTKFGAPRPFPEESGYLLQIFIDVKVAKGASGIGTKNTATVVGGGAAKSSTDVDQVTFSETSAEFGVTPGSFQADNFTRAYPFGEPARRAGDRPFELRLNVELNQFTGVGTDGTRYLLSKGLLRTVEVTSPRGWIGNPEATPKCDPVDFAHPNSAEMPSCPPDTQVGYLNAPIGGGTEDYGRGNCCSSFDNPNAFPVGKTPIYNLEPPKGTPSDFAFNVAGIVQGHIYAILDPTQNYAIKTVTPNISAPGLLKARSFEVTIWGVPGDSAHDRFRRDAETGSAGAPFGGAAIRPFLTNPMDCGFDNGGARIRVDSYEHPGEFSPVVEYGNPLNVEGCDDPRFRFEPDIALQPTDRHAGAPTGLDVHLEVPQRDDEVAEAKELYAENGFVKAIPTPPIKKAVVTFPEGMTINPSAAQGLVGCTPAQIGLGTNDPVSCPDNSQYGKLILHTPILPINEQPTGFIYIAKQQDNPFHNFLSLYLVIQEPDRSILIKIPGRLDLDPQTGQITTTFDDLPQFPVSDMQMTLKGGVRAGLVNPSTCGTKTITAEFFTWQDPTTPHMVKDHYDITQRPDGSPCVSSLGERPFKPSFAAGTANNAAGSYSPFSLELTRTDDDQEFSQLGVTLPPGLAAKFAGVGICSDAGIAQALSRETVAGDGALELADPSCPASSQIGTTEVGTGVGVPLTYVPGKVYLSGPYKRAPMSLVVISPAIVGPYDLGVITVRTALNVNPVTAQGEAISDSFPQIFQGIPVRIRDIRLKLDRPNFTLNPTSCAEKQIEAKITGTGGNLASTADDTAANLENRYQAADCASLAFKPALSFHLYGGTHRGAHPKLKAVVRARPGDANIAAASVALPHSEFLDQAHIKTVCTRVQFSAHECPAGSIIGEVEAKTPLFDSPLKGPIYLRSSSHKLPDLVAVLRGPDSQPVEVDLDGRIDSVNGGIRNSFEVVPDAPVEWAVFSFKGGAKGLFQNSTNLCASVNRATAKFSAQNGKAITLKPKMQNACGRKHHRKK